MNSPTTDHPIRDADPILRAAISAATLAKECILSGEPDRTALHKSTAEVVTQTDFESQRRIVDFLQHTFPDHRILAEESDEPRRKDAPDLWIVDPLDGTNNFANGIAHYAISIAYARNGIVTVGVVLDPVRDELFHACAGKGAFRNGDPISVTDKNRLRDAIVATGFSYHRGITTTQTLNTIQRLFDTGIRGIRRFGSAALDLCWVACGRFDAYFEYHLEPWDFAAGQLIVQEAGGIIRDPYGSHLTLHSDGAIATSPALYPDIRTNVQLPSPRIQNP
jgi:myo-inositol-1(or 4)-monophosphatase